MLSLSKQCIIKDVRELCGNDSADSYFLSIYIYILVKDTKNCICLGCLGFIFTQDVRLFEEHTCDNKTSERQIRFYSYSKTPSFKILLFATEILFREIYRSIICT